MIGIIGGADGPTAILISSPGEIFAWLTGLSLAVAGLVLWLHR